jgi:deoxyadenosine/deoxycytidine kinase
MKQYICIDGNIGAGKSTVLDELKSRGYWVFQEDLPNWNWCLDLYYKDPKRWAFTLQMAILNSMTKQYDIIKNLPNDLVFIERSPASGMVFTRNSLLNGDLTFPEFLLVENFYNRIGLISTKTFKINTPVDECLKRIKSRNRQCEQEISLLYLQQIDDEYNSLDYKKNQNLYNISGSVSDIVDYIKSTINC